MCVWEYKHGHVWLYFLLGRSRAVRNSGNAVTENYSRCPAAPWDRYQRTLAERTQVLSALCCQASCSSSESLVTFCCATLPPTPCHPCCPASTCSAVGSRCAGYSSHWTDLHSDAAIYPSAKSLRQNTRSSSVYK